MKTFSKQVVEDEVLMELADGTLSEFESRRVFKLIENSDADKKVFSDFESAWVLLDLVSAQNSGSR